MSSSEGSSTLKASVRRLSNWPSSCRSIMPDLSVSNVRKALLSYFLARFTVYSKLIIILFSIQCDPALF